MKSPPIILIFLLALLVFLAIGYVRFSETDKLALTHERPENLRLGRVVIGKTTIAVELAETEQQRRSGLSFRDSLAAGTGMLFVFPYPDYYSFWMKDMRFPLDIIWIADDKIVEIKSNLPPAESSIPPTYTPTQKANYVLEIGAGEAEQSKIRVGDTIAWQI